MRAGVRRLGEVGEEEDGRGEKAEKGHVVVMRMQVWTALAARASDGDGDSWAARRSCKLQQLRLSGGRMGWGKSILRVVPHYQTRYSRLAVW